MLAEERLEKSEKLLTAVVALMSADREMRSGDQEARRTEVVLAEAGLTIADIAAISGKKYDTVKSNGSAT